MHSVPCITTTSWKGAVWFSLIYFFIIVSKLLFHYRYHYPHFSVKVFVIVNGFTMFLLLAIFVNVIVNHNGIVKTSKKYRRHYLTVWLNNVMCISVGINCHVVRRLTTVPLSLSFFHFSFITFSLSFMNSFYSLLSIFVIGNTNHTERVSLYWSTR